jgi:quinol monooxygenase YgiN
MRKRVRRRSPSIARPDSFLRRLRRSSRPVRGKPATGGRRFSGIPRAGIARIHAAPTLAGPITFNLREAAMIIVTGSIHARADTVDEVRRLSLEHVARSRAEPGCLEHGVAVDANDGLRLLFFERWADRAALDAHFRVPASGAFVRQVARLAAQPPAIEAYEASAISLR